MGSQHKFEQPVYKIDLLCAPYAEGHIDHSL